MELAARVSKLEKAERPPKESKVYAEQAAVPKRNEMTKDTKELVGLIRTRRDKPPKQKLTIITPKETKVVEYLGGKYHPTNDFIKIILVVATIQDMSVLKKCKM